MFYEKYNSNNNTDCDKSIKYCSKENNIILIVIMSLTTFFKINPVTYKFVQLIFNYNKVIAKNNTKRISSQFKTVRSNVFVLSTALAFLWPVKKSKEVPEKIATRSPISVLNTADNLFENGHYEQCYALLKGYEDEPDVEIQWRISRVLYNMSKELKYDTKYKQELLVQAYQVISKQLESHDNHYAVHKWYALLLDAKSSLEGIKERIKQLETVKKHMDLAVTLNPSDATILYMLGEWCFQITEMPWHQRKIAEVLFATPPHSTYEDALEYFLRAETAQPRFYGLNLLRIGMCYYRLKKEDQAKYYLKLAASYPAKSNDDHRANTEAADFLKKMKCH
ncbi:regulator of microtubule dynamics protein 1-like [Anticarsia gemmatalis]|uniref:regulator of microtubule dynamics protein 1-like n=1 Tax=Anticarsia gemmatalis TaxID=129554 RepID=UPI003F76E384